MFNPNFNKYADMWCKICGEGDAVLRFTQSNISSSYKVINTNGDDSPEDEEVSSFDETYQCQNCMAESEDINELATESQNLAYQIWCKRNNIREEPIVDAEIEEDEE